MAVSDFQLGEMLNFDASCPWLIFKRESGERWLKKRQREHPETFSTDWMIFTPENGEHWRFFHGALRPQKPQGLLGTGEGGGRERLHRYHYTVTTRIKIGSDESHMMFH